MMLNQTTTRLTIAMVLSLFSVAIIANASQSSSSNENSLVKHFLGVTGFGAARKLQLNCATFDTTKDYHLIARHSSMALQIPNDTFAAKVEQHPLDTTGIKDDWSLVDSDATGYYHIVNKNSGQGINVKDYSSDPGAVLIQWPMGTGDNEKFCFSDVGDGYYTIVARHSNLALDVAGDSTIAGAEVLQWTQTGAFNQQFQVADVTEAPPSTGCATFDTSKSYNLIAVHSNKALGVVGTVEGAKAEQMPQGGSQAAWTFAPVGTTGHYHILNANSFLALNVAGNTNDDGAEIIQWAAGDAANDNWCFRDAGGGAYNIVSELSGDAIDITGESQDDGATAVQWPIHGGNNQRFMVAEASTVSLDCTTFDATKQYHIMARHSSKAMSIAGDSTAEGADVVQVTMTPDSPADMWTFQSLGDGYSHVVNVHSGQGINIGGESTEPGANLIQWPAGQGLNDDFCFVDLDNGYYSIVVKHSQLRLDVGGASMDDGASLLQWNPSTDLNQQFSVVEVAASTTSAPVTSAPTTSAPVTSAPITSAPVTSAPVTSAPVTSAPVTSAPVTSAPVTSAPVTSAPVTVAPSLSAGPSISPSDFPSTSSLPSTSPSVGSSAPSFSPAPKTSGSGASNAPSFVASTAPSLSTAGPSSSPVPSETPRLIPDAMSCTILPGGTFYITAQHSGKGVHASADYFGITQLPVGVDPSNEAEMWEFSLSGEQPGYVQIHNAGNDFGFNINNGAMESGTQIIQYPVDDGVANDNWCFVDQGDGFYAIVSGYSGLAFSVDNGSYDDGALFLQRPFTGLPSQKFKLTNVLGEPIPMPIGAPVATVPTVSTSPSIAPSNSAAPSEGSACATIALTDEVGDGIVYIITAQHSGKAMYTVEDSLPIVQMPANADIAAEANQWEFVPAERDGYYHIQNTVFNNALNIFEGSQESGGMLIHYPTDFEQPNDNFCLMAQGGGFYSIISEHSGMAVTVDGGSYEDGAILLQRPFTDLSNQKFLFTDRKSATIAMPIADPNRQPSVSLSPSVSPTLSTMPTLSTQPSVSSAPSGLQCQTMNSEFAYHITAKHSAKAINAQENGFDVLQQPVSTFDTDNWQLVPLENGDAGYYHIRNVDNNNVLNVNFDSMDANVEIIQWFEEEEAINDNWCFVKEGEGFFSIRSASSGLALSVRSGSYDNGVPIVQLPYTGLSSQLWLLTHYGTPAPPPIAPSPIVSLAPILPEVDEVDPVDVLTNCVELNSTQTYHILTRLTGRSLYAPGGSLAEGEFVVEAPEGISKADNWIFEKSSATENYYHVVNQNSGHVLNGQGYDAELLPPDATSLVDDWCIEPVGEMGYYRFVLVETEWLLTVDDFEPVQMVLQPNAGWAAQEFMIVPVNENVVGSQGVWSEVYTIPLVPVAGANLPDGKLLVWSGEYEWGFTQYGEGQTAVAIWDPATNTTTNSIIAHTNHEMFCPGTSVLPDSRVVITGGSNSDKVTIYDPRTNEFKASNSTMKLGRGYHAQTLTSDGSIFTVGGSFTGGIGNKAGEIWNSTTDEWELKPGILPEPFMTADEELAYRADNHVWIFEAPNGRIFHAGPSVNMNWVDLEGTGSVTPAGTRADDNDAMNGNAVMYDVGMILSLGGTENYDMGNGHSRAYTIDINDPTGTGAVTAARTGDLTFARVFSNSVVLPDGKVVVVGGMSSVFLFQDGSAILMAEIWDPATGIFTPLASMTVPRTYHSIALLGKDGRVIVGGGGLCDDCLTNHPDFEILTPPYLLNDDDTPKVRPVMQSAPATLEYGQTFVVQMDTPGAHTFGMVRTGASTHAINNDMRRVPCTVVSDDGNGAFTLTFDSRPSVTLPGVWFLFAMNEEGTPSVSESVMIHPL